MASHHLTGGQVHSTAALERYLGELSAQLRGPRAARTRVLAEIRDGLTDTVDAHLTNGIPPDVAATTAIAQFGDPATVAHSFGSELATAYARRAIVTYIATGPLIGIWWLLLLHPVPWRGGVLSALIAIPALPLVALAIGTAAGTVATTGGLIRWLPETSASRALTATIAIAALCLAADLTVLSVLAAHLAAGGHLPSPLVAAAVTASIVRMAGAITAIRSARLMRDRLQSD